MKDFIANNRKIFLGVLLLIFSFLLELLFEIPPELTFLVLLFIIIFIED